MVKTTNIRFTEASVTEPVLLPDVKTYLVIDFDDDDDLLTTLIKSARQSVEHYLNLALVTKTITADVEVTGLTMDVRLPYAKSVSGVVVTELNSEDEATTLASGTDYYIRGGFVRMTDAGRFTLSYTNIPGTIPEAIKEAIKMEVENKYNKEVGGLTDAIKEKLNPYVEIWL